MTVAESKNLRKGSRVCWLRLCRRQRQEVLGLRRIAEG
jgi:hypothetical protein